MENPNHQQLMPSGYAQSAKQDEQNEQNRVNFLDYFSVLWKRKWGIIIIIIIIVSAAVIHSLMLPNIYQAEALVKIGKFQGKEIEPYIDIKTIFENENTLKQIIKDLALPDDTILREFASTFTLDSIAGIIKISAKAESPKQAVEIVNVVAQHLVNRHKNIMKEALESFEKDIELLNREKKRTSEKIVETKQDIIWLDQEIKNYQNEVAKRAEAKSEAQGRIAENYIQLLAGSKNEKEAKQKTIITLEQQLVDFDAAYQKKDFDRAYGFSTTEVVAPALPPQKKIGPNRRANVKISGFAAIFIGLIYAFIAEGYRKYINWIKRII